MNRVTNHHLFKLVESLRTFFSNEGFTETLTPPIVENPGIETHLHPFQLYSPLKQRALPHYLHTSPEFYMKKLLSEGFEKIYQISYAFRDEPDSATHRKQFLMLEWYRSHSHYSDIKDDVINLIDYCHRQFELPGPTLQKVTVDELFREYLHFSILDFLEPQELKSKILLDYSKHLHEHDSVWPWEDYFFLLFLNEVEPHLKELPLVMIDKYPAPLAALSTISQEDSRTCDRFEVYMHGIEVANCFNELVNLEEQKKRFDLHLKQKENTYAYTLPCPNVLFKALESGLPHSSGIALGVERLLMGLFKQDAAYFLD